MYAQVLQKRLANSQDKNTLYLLQDINNQADRLTNLINDLLNVNKLTSGSFMLHKRIFDVNALIEKLVTDFNHINTTHAIIKKGTITESIIGDENRIEQVITNLLTNAIKYSPKGSKVIVHTALDKNKENVLISVQDFGFGINKKDQGKIFERFYRTKDKDEGEITGFGLGLYITKEIVSRHNGRIWVESKKGKGSTFYVSLPIRLSSPRLGRLFF